MFLFSDFILEVKVESEFIDDYPSLVKGVENNNIVVDVDCGFGNGRKTTYRFPEV